MSFNKYYKTVDPDLRKHLVNECTTRNINYRTIWNKNRTSYFEKEIGETQKGFSREIGNAVFILDFCILWFNIYASLMAISFFKNSTVGKYDIQHNVMNLIAWRVCSDLAAVRCLVLEGLDVQAKQVLRSASENIDALGVAALDQQFASDFVRDQDIEENKKTWFKHIAKGKARKQIISGLQGLASIDISESIKYRDQEEAVLSAAAHPSLISGFVSLFPNYDEDEELDSMENTISHFSVRTLSYCCYRLLEHMIYDIVLFKSYERFIHNENVKFPKIAIRSKNIIDKGREISFILHAYMADPGNFYTLQKKSENLAG